MLLLFAIVKKKPRDAGLFDVCLNLNLGEGGLVDHGLREFGSPGFLEYFGRRIHAGSAAGGYAELALQVPDGACAGLRGFANLLIGDSVANTDVHKFNTLGTFKDLNANENDCQYDYV